MKSKKETKHLSLRIDPLTLEKFHYVCEYDGRSANGQILTYIRSAIREFEAQHGEIKTED